MDNIIDNSEIRLWIHEIIDTIGIREPVKFSHFKRFTNKKKLTELIETIALYMNLPIKPEVEFVDDNYQSGKINFETKNLTNYESNGKGKNGIIAEVQIPGNLPLYGTSGLDKMPIKIKVSNSCLESSKMFITIMSHELTHVLLHSLKHKNKDNEFFTDLTAMTLGFVDIFNEGRSHSYETKEEHLFSSTTTTHSSTCGYLSDAQFEFARDLIKKNLNGYRNSVKKLKNKINKFEKNVQYYNQLLIDFTKYKVLLDKNYSIKFKNNDTSKIISIHQVDYLDHRNDVVKYHNIMVKQIKSDFQNINKSNLYCKKNIINCDKLVIESSSEIGKEITTLIEDFNLLGKYISAVNRLRIKLKIS